MWKLFLWDGKTIIFNGIMLVTDCKSAPSGLSTTGVGDVVSGVWYAADLGTGAVNYLSGNGFTTLSDIIDNSNWGQEHTKTLYDGF